MKLAISNIAWPADLDETVYPEIQTLGYEGIEIAPTRIFSDAPYEHLNEAYEWARALKDRYGFSIPSMQSIWFGRTENIWSSEEEKNALLEYTKKAIHFAEATGCRNMVFGCPRNRNMSKKVDEKDVVEFFYSIGEYAAEHGTVIGLEANPTIYNTNFINTTVEAIELIKKVNSKGLRLNLDIGTMLANSERVDILAGNEYLISHVHISEMWLAPIRERELHQNIMRVLYKSGYDGFVSVEMKQVPLEEIKGCCTLLANYLKSM